MRLLKPFLLVFVSAILGAVVGWYGRGWSTNDQALAEAEEARRQGKTDLALRLAQLQLRTSAGFHPNAERVIARCLASQKKWSEAAKAFDHVVSSTPEDFALHSKALYQIDLPQDALAVCQKGLERFPGDPRLSELETRMYGFHQQNRGALASAERLQAVPGKKMMGLLLGGLIHYQAKNFQSAADWLRKALDVSPTLEGQSGDFPRIELDEVDEAIAASLLVTENQGDALQYAERAFRAKPKAERAVMAAKACIALRRPEEQRRWLDRALELNPEYVDAVMLNIELAISDGRLDEAKRSIDAANKFASSPNVKHGLDLSRARLGAALRAADAKAKQK